MNGRPFFAASWLRVRFNRARFHAKARSQNVGLFRPRRTSWLAKAKRGLQSFCRGDGVSGLGLHAIELSMAVAQFGDGVVD